MPMDYSKLNNSELREKLKELSQENAKLKEEFVHSKAVGAEDNISIPDLGSLTVNEGNIQNNDDVSFASIFNLDEIQKLQNDFAKRIGVASIISLPDGTPITKPSNFTRLCNDIIRNTEIGKRNCYHSDAEMGSYNPKGATCQPCLSGGLLDAGARITVGDKHLANWLIGQVREPSVSDDKLLEYADLIGADKDEYKSALSEISIIPKEEFEKIADILFLFANVLSEIALKLFNQKQLNMQLAKSKDSLQEAKQIIEEHRKRLQVIFETTDDLIVFLSLDDEVVWANRAAIEAINKEDIDTITGDKYALFWVECQKKSDIFASSIKKVKQSKKANTGQIRINCNQHWLVDTFPIFENEDLVGIVEIVKDITKRVAKDKAFHDAERKMSSLFLASPTSILLINADNTIIDVNPMTCKLLGYDLEDLRGKNSRMIYNSDEEYAYVSRERIRQIEKNATASLETVLLSNDFRLIPVIQSATLIDDNNPAKGMVITVLDISDRKNAEEKLIISELMLREAQKLAKVGHFTLNLIEKKWHSSDTLDDIAGIDKSFDKTLESWLSIIHDDDRDVVNSYLINEVIGKKLYFDMQYRIITLDSKREKWVHTLGKLKFNNKYEPIRMVGTIQDITVQKKNEIALINAKNRAIKSENYIQGIFDIAPIGIGVIQDKVFKEINKGLCKITGYSKDELLNQPVKMLYETEEEYNAASQDRTYKHITDISTIVVETKWKRKNGNTVNVIISYTFLDSEDPAKGFIFSVQDITERKRYEDQLKTTYALLERGTIIRFIWKNEKGWPVEYVTNNVKEVFGYEAPKFHQPSFKYADLIHPDDLATVEAEAEAIAHTDVNAYEHQPYRIITKNGDVKWVKEMNILSRDENGQIVHFEGLVFDVSSQKQFEVDIIEAKQKAEESDRLKSAFLANMSHEIRTPMNSIMGFTNLLMSEHVEPEATAKFLSIIEQSGNRMLSILNDLIDISKIESGQVTVSYEDTNLKELIDFINNLFLPEIKQKGLELFYNLDIENDYETIHTDKEKLYAIISNLVKNAIKYSDKGKIEVHCKMEESYYHFYVKDEGIGIAIDKQEDVFLRFIQEDAEDTRAKQGAGLGLAITKAMH
ncbi:MAG: hypothetical protein B7C24_17295 [Bacteroidetes bacterium 4572_77]|nr:MAG: hypothetical protein B7C24_17295 [Bacteroidetes bacterium 4572_77]